MNQDNDNQEAAEVDPQVSAHYEKLADEETPPGLDRAVLREAARAVRADNRMGSFGAWFRPVAFMTTVGLSLAIILDLSDTSIFSPPAELSFEDAPADTAAEDAARNRLQMTPIEVMRQKKSVTAQSLSVDAPDKSGDAAAIARSQPATVEPAAPEAAPLFEIQSDLVRAKTGPEAESIADQAVASEAFSAEDPRAEQRIQKIEANSNANLQSQPTAAAQFSASQPAIAIESSSLVAPMACSDEQKSDVEAWWQCIAELRQSGLAENADQELEKLREDFPDFELPK